MSTTVIGLYSIVNRLIISSAIKSSCYPYLSKKASQVSNRFIRASGTHRSHIMSNKALVHVWTKVGTFNVKQFQLICEIKKRLVQNINKILSLGLLKQPNCELICMLLLQSFYRLTLKAEKQIPLRIV